MRNPRFLYVTSVVISQFKGAILMSFFVPSSVRERQTLAPLTSFGAVCAHAQLQHQNDEQYQFISTSLSFSRYSMQVIQKTVL